MNKEEAKQKIAAIIDKVSSLQEELDTLEFEAYKAYLAVRPYDGRYVLTIEQNEMKEWFMELKLTSIEAKYSLGGIKNYFGLLYYQYKRED